MCAQVLASLFVGAPEFRAPEFRALLLWQLRIPTLYAREVRPDQPRSLLGQCSQRLPVGDTALPHSLEPGIGAMATPMQASALRPDPLATVADCSGDELKNTCFLCVAVGKPVAECMIEARPCTSHKTYTNGHSRPERHEIVCAEFDSWATRSHKSAKQRDQMRAEAAKSKRNRLLKVRRNNKK